MGVLSILNTYNPSINTGEDIAELDAEIDMSLITRVKVTSYPLETGQMVSNSFVLLPSEVKFTWAIGVRRVGALLSTDAGKNLESNMTGYLGGFASNLTQTGLGAFSLGLLSGALLKQDQEASRAFTALKILQSSQLSGNPLNITMHNLGTLNNVVITELKLSRRGKDGGKFIFDIIMTQLQVGSNKNTAAGELEKPTRGGQITGIEL